MKKIIALLMALAMIMTFVACGKKDEGAETTTEATTEAATVVDVNDQDAIDDILNGGGEETPEEESEEATSVVEVTNADGEAVTDEDGEAVTETVTKKPSDDKKPEGEKKTTTKKAEVDPSTWNQDYILKYYSAATANVASKKPGYTKTRSAKLGGYEAGTVLSAFKGEVFKFLGIGDENKFEAVVAKGTNTTDDQCGDFLKASTLTAADITSAKATKSGNTITITIGIKDGSSQTEGGKNANNKSPIDKTGICAGSTDRGGFDHKTAIITYDALDDIAPSLTMYEKNNNGKVVATIDASTGEIQKLVVSWDASAEISKVYGSSATLSASTTVTYTNFGW